MPPGNNRDPFELRSRSRPYLILESLRTETLRAPLFRNTNNGEPFDAQRGNCCKTGIPLASVLRHGLQPFGEHRIQKGLMRDGRTCFGRFPKWVKTDQSALRFEIRLLLILQLREEFYE